MTVPRLRWLVTALLLAAGCGSDGGSAGDAGDEDSSADAPDAAEPDDAGAPESDFGPGNPVFGQCWDPERGCFEARQLGAGGPMPPDAGGRFWVRSEGGGADAELCFVEDAMVAFFLRGWEPADCATGPCEENLTRDIGCAALPAPDAADCGYDAAAGVFGCDATDPIPLEASVERTMRGIAFCVGDPMAACDGPGTQTCCNYATSQRANTCRNGGSSRQTTTECGVSAPPAP